MRFGGFNEEIAEANGFDIQVMDGVETSVPITDEAKAMQAAADAARAADGVAAARGLPYCGGSYVIGERLQLARVSISTGYDVYFPSVYHHWIVAVTTNIGFVHDENFDGLNASASWDATHTTPTRDSSVSSGGIVSLALNNYVDLANGTVCYAEPNTDTF